MQTVEIDSAYRAMIKTNKRIKKLHVLMKTTWHKRLFVHPRVTYGQFIYMSFGAKVVITRFIRRKERVNTMTNFLLSP